MTRRGILLKPLLILSACAMVAVPPVPARAAAQESALTSMVVQKVTLEQAIAKARADNALLQAARQGVIAGEGRLKEARSYFLPNLSLTESFSRTDNPVYVFMGKLTQQRFGMMDFAIPALNDPAPINNYRSRAELTLPLFTGGKILAGYRAAKMGVEAARNTSAYAESSVVKGVTEAFYGSLLARQAVAVLRESVKTAKAHLNQVEAMYKQGLVLDSDLLRMKVFAADVEQREASRKADYQVAEAYLGYAMGTRNNVSPEGKFEPVSTTMPSLEEAGKAAIVNRGDLKAMALRTGQAGEGVRMARSAYLPQVGLMASYEQDTEDWTPGTSGDNWMVGVQFRLPLFDGGARAGRLQIARARRIQAQKALTDLRQKIFVQVKSAWLRANAAARRVAVTTDSEAQARENQRIIALRYRQGLAAITDLLDADTALTVASLQRSKAIHDELVEQARLEWAMGKNK